ncbi:MAG TPA: DUF2188 domain-containing protein [Mycobacteriales bacterium]|nr:DUF2188 domain-containing protein [Mycobacteriales bacterium]
MAWFFRALEQPDGQWVCRRGRADIDAHPTLEHAIEHLRELASDAQPAQLVIHRLDGSAEPRGPLVPEGYSAG